MKQLEDITIDWKTLEEESGLRPSTLAAMAGVTPSMWCQVKLGNKEFSTNTKFRLLMSLAKHFNFQNEREKLEVADEIVSDYAKMLVTKFPLAS